MTSYVQDVQAFMRETTVRQMMPHWPGKRLHSSDFSELWVKLEKDHSVYTLEQLNELRDKHSANINLSAVLLSVKSLLPGQSLFAVWQIPTAAVSGVMEKIGSAECNAFYKIECAMMIILDSKLLYLSYTAHVMYICIGCV